MLTQTDNTSSSRRRIVSISLRYKKVDTAFIQEVIKKAKFGLFVLRHLKNNNKIVNCLKTLVNLERSEMKINLIAIIAFIFYSAFIQAGEAAPIIIENRSDVAKTDIKKVDRSSTADPEYPQKVINAIGRNSMMGRSLGRNHKTEVRVTTSEEGRVLSLSIIQSSGNTEWNDSVMKAIERTGTLPKDAYGIVPSPMILIFSSGK